MTSFDVSVVQIGAGVLAVGWRKNQKTTCSRVTRRAFSHIWWRKGVIVSWWNFAWGRGQWRNHPCKFRWRSVQEFLRERGSNFPLSHWLALSSLKHSGTTVPACDERYHRERLAAVHSDVSVESSRWTWKQVFWPLFRSWFICLIIIYYRKLYTRYTKTMHI